MNKQGIKSDYVSPIELITDVSWDAKAPNFKNTKGSSHHSKKWSNGRSYNDDDWYGTPDYQSAENIVFEGSNFERINSIRKQTLRAIESMEVKRVFDVSGGYLDLGRYLDKNPDCMVSRKRKAVEQKDIHVVVNICESSGVSGEALERKGAIISAMIDRLEMNQIARVKLTVASLWKDYNGNKEIIKVRIKDYGQPLNLAQLSGSLHPSFFRRIIFAWIEKYHIEASQRGYGRVLGFPDFTKRQLDSHFNADKVNTLFIGNISCGDSINQQIKNARTPEEMGKASNALIDSAKKKFDTLKLIKD